MKKNITPVLIQPSISQDIFQSNIESFQQEFNQDSIDPYVSNETEEMSNVDEMLDEIVQMYQEIMEEPVEEKSNILGEIKMSFNDIASENSMTLVTEELSDDFKLNIKTDVIESEINKSVLDLGKVDQEHCQYKIKENIVRWVLQQQPMRETQFLMINEKESWEKTNPQLNIASEISSDDNLKRLKVEYQWKRRKKLGYKNTIDADFTVPQILNC